MLSQKHTESDAESEAGGGGGDAEGAVTPGSVSNGEGTKEFLSTGRTGRRNAMPDILGQHAETGTADLPSRLEALTTKSGTIDFFVSILMSLDKVTLRLKTTFEIE